jgi:hypothetical protein
VERVRVLRKAVKELIQYCERREEETGEPAAEILKHYLKLLKTHRRRLRDRWPASTEPRLLLEEADTQFIEAEKKPEERLKRFTLICLRDNITSEGFNSEGFTGNIEFYGERACWGCVVPDAVGLRDHLRVLEEHKRKVAEDMKREEPSWLSKEMSEHYKKPEAVKRDKMVTVKLALYEEIGAAKGRSCIKRHKYRCPYGELADKLVKKGRFAEGLWKTIEYYEDHWNPPPGYLPGRVPVDKWNHYEETGLIEVTDYEDVKKALHDGRLEKIVDEFLEHREETGRHH